MKKLLITLCALGLFISPAYAATIVSNYSINLDQNEAKDLAPVIITSTSSGDITAEHGIRIMFDPDPELEVLFHHQPLNYIGTAIDNGRINLNVVASFAPNYKSLFIPVMEDFEAGDWLQIDGLALRVYDKDFGPRRLGLDLDGDFVVDVEDINDFEVENTVDNDLTAPYAVQNAAYKINDNGSVTLTWDVPPDYDYDGTAINRTRIKNGKPALASVYEGFLGTFTDTDLDDVTSASYSIVATDVDGNWSEAVVLEVDLTAPAKEEVVEETPVEETEEDKDPVATDEIEELKRLANYYNVRYSIKCMPSGVKVPENDSACLWARIDLIYTQELTGNILVEDLALSDSDLSRLATRRKWPEMRYEDNCITAKEPASYCSALGKAIERTSYFLD